MLKAVLCLAALVASASAQCAPNGALDAVVPANDKLFIQSPNFGNGDYPNNANCQWNVNSPNSAKLAIEVNSVAFALEGGSCGYDYVTIFEIKPNGAEVQLGKFCGDAGPQRLVANSTQVKVVFRTDSSITRRGFNISFSDPVCNPGANLCSGSETVCIRPDQYCDETEDCPDGSDEGPGCSGECGTTTIPPKEDKNARAFRNLVAARAMGGDRIVGGVEATPHSLPWQVAMLSSSGSQICGGSIINSQWVMTAAHCCKAYAPTPSNYRVRCGAHILGATNEPYAKTYTLEKLIVHPSYQRPSTYSNDFCLLKINGIFDFGPHVGAICLADEDDCAAGTAAMVSGWGSVRPARMGDQMDNFDEFIKHIKDAEAGLLAKEDDPNSPQGEARVSNLNQVYVDVTTQAYCSSAYPGSISNDMICAARAGKDSCQGDSGGPFVQRNAEGTWKLCGVVSWGRGCAQARYPGVYARITTALEWIMSTILSN